MAHAELTFWYRISTQDRAPYDRFFQYYALADGLQAGVELPMVTGQWTLVTRQSRCLPRPVNCPCLAAAAGQHPAHTVWIDDVRVCLAVCGQPDGGDVPPGGGPFCWKQKAFADYAPSACPTSTRSRPPGSSRRRSQWAYDAPVAAANSLWWFDSKFETRHHPAALGIRSLLAGHALRRWDDHDAAQRAAAGQGPGQPHANEQRPARHAARRRRRRHSRLPDRARLATSYTVTLKEQPAWDWVKDEVKRSEDVVLLLGFWELQKDGWKRLGGHYVTAAGVSCYGDGIAISDPWRDNAERGGLGEILGAPIPHPHPLAPPDALHNDAERVSHDFYGILNTTTPGGVWGLAGYVRTYDDIANFLGANTPMGLISYQTDRWRKGQILAVAERAIAVSPVRANIGLRIEPATQNVMQGRYAKMTLVIEDSGQMADTVAAYINYDPTVLQAVDGGGNPATSVETNPSWPAPITNVVDPVAGHIDLVFVIPGGMPIGGNIAVAALNFRALQTTPSYGSAVEFDLSESRHTDVLGGGLSKLGATTPGFVVVSTASSLSGSVLLQGRPEPPDSSWMTPLVLSLHEPGAPGAIASYVITTTNGGKWLLPGAPMGTFDVTLKGLHTLRNRFNGVQIAAGVTDINMGTLLEGDASNDNVVNASDLSIYAMAAGKHAGDAGWDTRADFDNNGAVNDADLALLQANMGRSGDLIVNPELSPVLSLLPEADLLAWLDGVGCSAGSRQRQPQAVAGVEQREHRPGA